MVRLIGVTAMEYDVKLVRNVFAEPVNGFLVSASLDRFGGLAVFCTELESGICRYQSENILEARKWAKANKIKGV
jgi:hypothetical protein